MVIYEFIPVASLHGIGQRGSLFVPGTLERVVNVDILGEDMGVVD